MTPIRGSQNGEPGLNNINHASALPGDILPGQRNSLMTLQFLIGSCVFLVLGPLAFSQGTTIVGRVTDPSGAVLPDARVTATQEETQVATSSSTNQEGYYALPSVAVGRYTITVQLKGFNTE